MHSSFALLQVHRVRRQIPVNGRVAVGVKSESFLSQRRSSQDKWPEGGVERSANLVGTCRLGAVFGLLITETHHEARPQSDRFVHGPDAGQRRAGPLGQWIYARSGCAESP